MLNVLEKLLCHFPPFSIVKKNCIWRRLYLKTQNLKNSEKMIKAASLLHIIFQRFFCCPLAQPSGWGVYLLTPPMYELLPFATIFSTIQPYDKKNSQKVEKKMKLYMNTYIPLYPPMLPRQRYTRTSIEHILMFTFFPSLWKHKFSTFSCIVILYFHHFNADFSAYNQYKSIHLSSSHPSLPHPDSELLTPQTSLNWSL